MAAEGSKRSWVDAYSAVVVDPEEEERARQSAEDAYLADVRAAWGVGAPGCSHDHSAEQRIFDLTEEQKQVSCDYLLQCGHSYLRECAPSLALEQYRLCLAYSEYAFPGGADGQAKREATRARAMLGTAYAHAQSKPYPDWSAALTSCAQVQGCLSFPSLFPQCHEACSMASKVALLQAQAQAARGEYEDALVHAEQARACCCTPSPCAHAAYMAGEASFLCARVSQLQAQYSATSAQVAKRMLGKGDGGEPAREEGLHGPVASRRGTTAYLLR